MQCGPACAAGAEGMFREKRSETMSDDVVFLGVDLGTSRTSITSSTGVRETVWSYVGYPKDHVAKKKFGGREVVYGKEAVDNRLALDLIRPLAGGSIKSREGRD